MLTVISCYLSFTTLLANSAEDKLMKCFLIFSQKTEFDISGKFLPLETICNGDILHEMPNPVFWENKKHISICAENFTQSAKC